MRHYVYMEFAIARFDGSVIGWLTIPDDKPATLSEMAKPCKFITSLIKHFSHFCNWNERSLSHAFPPLHAPGKHEFGLRRDPLFLSLSFTWIYIYEIFMKEV
jgi:hypothetical protein